jgi:transcriptional regulator with XRE-family HTH domain
MMEPENTGGVPMEETLGKRIAEGRKRLGITQDRLAEQLGVTAQAVSKWENDQSCPDITILPKLAKIFGISTDMLLGLVPTEPETAKVAELVTDQDDDQDHKHNFELHWDAGRKGSIGFAVWVLLMGGMMLYNVLTHHQIDLWDIAWPCALLLFGLDGIYPEFSFFRFGCALFGGYSLLENMQFTFFGLSSQLLLTIAVLLFGLSLLVDALRKPHKPHFSVTHNGNTIKKMSSACNIDGDSFDCDCAFGEKTQVITMPVLRQGNADICFGNMTLDLTAVERFAPDCRVDADCSFAELTILIPRQIRAEVDSETAFGAVDIQGSHATEPVATIRINVDVSFGQITVKYI